MKRRRMPAYGDWIVGQAVKGLIRLFRHTDPRWLSDFCGGVARRIGPRLRSHRIGQDALRHAFPERDDAWIEATLRAAWENVGRVAGEYAHMDRIWDFDPAHPDAGRIVSTVGPLFETLRDDGKPALVFAAHLANWELAAVAGHALGVPSAVVYRMPNNRIVAQEISRIRAPLMGRLIRTRAQAAMEMAAALEAGLHLGMLVDQHFSRGVDVTFFGRRCKANPSIARLARWFDCPVIGLRVIRLPDQRFRIEATEPLTLPRDAEGKVDVVAGTQMVTDVIEGWIREYPGQWLWFHRRWR